MFARILRAFKWNKAVNLATEGKFEESLTALDEINQIEPLRYYESVFRMTVILRRGDYESAKNDLVQMSDILSREDNLDKKYTKLYCDYIVAELEGDLDRKRAARREALALNCSAGLKSALPL